MLTDRQSGQSFQLFSVSTVNLLVGSVKPAHFYDSIAWQPMTINDFISCRGVRELSE